MKKFIVVVVGCFCLSMASCYKDINNDDSNPIKVLPTEVTDETDAKIWEVPTPQPRREKGEIVYPLPYGDEEATTKNKAEWESWLQDPSMAPLPKLHSDMDFVLTWCHQFAQFEPEDVGLILMNYFEYDIAYIHPSNPFRYTNNPGIAFFNWAGLRKCIEDRSVVCAGYAQLFYLIVREKYPDVKYITSKQINHARNYFEDEHWDITWLDDEGVDYNPNKIKFDYIGMQRRISRGIEGNVGTDWKVINIKVGEGR
jgi:hypothetical protein